MESSGAQLQQKVTTSNLRSGVAEERNGLRVRKTRASDRCGEKLQAPSAKLQRNCKFQAPGFNFNRTTSNRINAERESYLSETLTNQASAFTVQPVRYSRWINLFAALRSNANSGAFHLSLVL